MATLRHLQALLLATATTFTLPATAQSATEADSNGTSAAMTAPALNPNGDISFHTLPIDLHNCQVLNPNDPSADKLQRCALAAFGMDLYWFNSDKHSTVQFAPANSEQPQRSGDAARLLNQAFFEAQGPLKVFSRKMPGQQPPLQPLVAFIDYLVGEKANQLNEERWMIYMTDPRANCALVPVAVAKNLPEAQQQAQALIASALNCKKSEKPSLHNANNALL